MRPRALLLVVLAMGALGVAPASRVLAQSLDHVQAQLIWREFWDRVLAGDLDAARRHMHSTRRHLFPFRQTVAELQDIARQMQHCHVRPEPVPTGGEDLMFEVRCEHAGQTAETMIALRRDFDGVWRLTSL